MYQVKVKDFDLRKNCYSGQCFRMAENERGNFFVIANEEYMEFNQENDLLTIFGTKEDFDGFWMSYLGLSDDYTGIKARLLDNDAYMQKAMEFGKGIRILNQDCWEMIISFLISQQNNIPRIKQCINSVCKSYGKEKVNAYGEIYYTFPTPLELSKATEQELRALNLGYRAKYIVRTANEIASGQFDLDALKKADYETAKKMLLTLYGVGIKVAECVCLYGLHHMDAFPVDTHIKHVLDTGYPDGFPIDEYRGVIGILQQYAFYYDLKQNWQD